MYVKRKTNKNVFHIGKYGKANWHSTRKMKNPKYCWLE